MNLPGECNYRPHGLLDTLQELLNRRHQLGKFHRNDIFSTATRTDASKRLKVLKRHRLLINPLSNREDRLQG